MVVRLGIPPAGISPGFHAAIRSAGSRPPLGAGSDWATCIAFETTQGRLDVSVEAAASPQRLVVGSAVTEALLAATQMMTASSAADLKSLPHWRENLVEDLGRNSRTRSICLPPTTFHSSRQNGAITAREPPTVGAGL